LNPVFDEQSQDTNLIFNPSFEDIDPQTGLPFKWDSKSSYGLLKETGESNNGIEVFPFYGKSSLRLSLSNDSDSVVVSQTLFIAETPNALNFSGYGNNDLFSTTSIITPMLSIEIEYIDVNDKSSFNATFDTKKNGWQESFKYVDKFPGTIYAIHVYCTVSNGIGLVFFDNVTLTFYN